MLLTLVFLNSLYNGIVFSSVAKKSTRPINRRISATGSPTLPIYVTGLEKIGQPITSYKVVKRATTHSQFLQYWYFQCSSILL